MSTVTLSLVSHTNVGKTTLARTLLGADVGEIRDAPHVTEFADGHELIESPEGDRLRLWDTPGFGDSARLAKRLLSSSNPMGWFMSQVWDRWRDRGFWASQQAMRHVQAESDVVLYLVNAAESPATAGYVAAEMDLLTWVGKPVLVLLNQMGEPQPPALEAAEIQRWKTHLARWPRVQAVMPLDAFARCWVHEQTLLQTVQRVLQEDQKTEKAEAMARLGSAWAARNQQRFDAAMTELAASLARMALARELVVETPGLASRLSRFGSAMGASLGAGRGVGTVQHPANAEEHGATAASAATPAEQALDRTLGAEVKSSTDRLLALHGLAGHARADILRRVAGQFVLREKVSEGRSALLGGAVTGAVAGLKADVASGGLTLGGGMLAGALLGALGGGSVARLVNVVRGTDRSWLLVTPQALDQYVAEAVLRYLAVAHFGRGRGEWVQSEAPPHWPETVEAVLAAHHSELAALWAGRDPKAQTHAQPHPQTNARTNAQTHAQPHVQTPDTSPLATALASVLKQAVQDVFSQLYPAAPSHP